MIFLFNGDLRLCQLVRTMCVFEYQAAYIFHLYLIEYFFRTNNLPQKWYIKPSVSMFVQVQWRRQWDMGWGEDLEETQTKDAMNRRDPLEGLLAMIRNSYWKCYIRQKTDWSLTCNLTQAWSYSELDFILRGKPISYQCLCNVASLRDVFAMFLVCHSDPLLCYHLPRI